MKSFYKYLIITVVLLGTGCRTQGKDNQYDEKANPDSYGFNCVTVVKTFNVNLNRCENTEAVCYYMDGGFTGGLSCKWKENYE